MSIQDENMVINPRQCRKMKLRAEIEIECKKLKLYLLTGKITSIIAFV